MRCASGNAAALDADECEALRAGLLLDDLMGNPDDGPPDLVPGHDLPVGHRSLAALHDAVLLPGLTVPVVKGSGEEYSRSPSAERSPLLVPAFLAHGPPSPLAPRLGPA